MTCVALGVGHDEWTVSASSPPPSLPPRESLLVFSDVHLGNDLDDRYALAPARSSVDRDLVELLAHYRRVPPRGVRWRIVVAGDFIDFIGMTIAAGEDSVASLNEEERAHGLGSAVDHALEKLRRVAARHADVLAALATFVQDGHALTFVHGNHDVELHWDEVKTALADILADHAARHADGAFDRDAFLARIEFQPWFFWREGVCFIEHGHQYDPFCATSHVMAPLSPADPRRIARGFCDVLLRFVVRPTRGLRESGHENVGFAHYVSFGTSLGVRGAARLFVRFVQAVRELFAVRRAALSETAQALRAEHERRIARFAEKRRLRLERLRALLALQVEPVTGSVHGILASLLLDRIAALLATLAVAAVLAVAGVLRVSTRGAIAAAALTVVWVLVDRALARMRSVDPAARMTDRAGHLARLFPAAFVVMGHTHAPSATRAGDATYVNVGSWSEIEDDVDRAARTHLVIHETASAVEGTLLRWPSAESAPAEDDAPRAVEPLGTWVAARDGQPR